MNTEQARVESLSVLGASPRTVRVQEVSAGAQGVVLVWDEEPWSASPEDGEVLVTQRRLIGSESAVLRWDGLSGLSPARLVMGSVDGVVEVSLSAEEFRIVVTGGKWSVCTETYLDDAGAECRG